MVFGCILENTIKNTFFTYCLHFLTFSQLSNKYIISFPNTETQKKQNPGKKFIKFGQIERKRRRERRLGLIQKRDCTVDAKVRSRGRGEIKRRWSRSLLDRRTAKIDEIGGVWVVGLEFGLRSALLWLSNWSSV